nr:MAG TPA: hypothetical protein [Caudoviricetes sp.]
MFACFSARESLNVDFFVCCIFTEIKFEVGKFVCR